jgi:peroxiredoxin
MTLEERLATIREQSRTRMFPEARAVLLGSVDDLRASGIMQRVANVGSRAPEFRLPNAAGQPVRLEELRAHGALLLPRSLVTVLQCGAGRSARDLPEITAAGASLVVVSSQVARTPRETAEPKPLTFEMLRDFGNRVAEAYGLVFTLPDDVRDIYLKNGIDLARGNGDGTWCLPIPARFVIDREGIVRAVDADPDSTQRPEPAHTVEILRQLRIP